jgi:predicted unusual protein kinase regulating ubiquinone biosynthesis (AarF/ABC1/UbiB family)
VIDWKSILAEAPSLAKRLATGEGVVQLGIKLESILPERIVIAKVQRDGLSSELASEDGSLLLELYFRQFQSDQGMFLDLRPQNFSRASDNTICWHPNGLWNNLGPEFRYGMLSIYQGYYSEKPELMRQGLKRVGLIREDFSPALIDQVEKMILGHIGGELSQQEFKVQNFTESFERLFQFLLKEKIVLSSDFLYLGIYLASLYIHLEKLGGSYDVRKAFLAGHKMM